MPFYRQAQAGAIPAIDHLVPRCRHAISGTKASGQPHRRNMVDLRDDARARSPIERYGAPLFASHAGAVHRQLAIFVMSAAGRRGGFA